MADIPDLSRLQRLGEGAEAEVFALDEARVLRIMRAQGQGPRVEQEALALASAAAAGIRVPRVFERFEVDGRAGVVMERLEGPDYLSRIGMKPWSVFSVGRVTGELHARINAVPAPPGLRSGREACFEGLERLAGELQGMGPDVRRILDTLPDGDRLCHGDFHPGQILAHGGEPVAIDWPAAARGDPDGDHARTLVLLRLGEPPPGVSATLTLLARFGRTLLLRAYRKAYRRSRPTLDAGRLERWITVMLACRLGDRIPGERERVIVALRARL